MSELAGKVAVVTGASGGIGRVISVQLARAGAQVVLAGRDHSALDETARMVVAAGALPPLICHLDLLDRFSINAVVAKTLETFGHIDALVNNSGITGNALPMAELPEQDWDQTIDTNLKGPFLLTQRVLPDMLAQKCGSIVFIGSVTGKRPFRNRSAYAASKLGLVGLMRTLALEVASQGIRVNLISPGFVAGPRLEGVVDNVADMEEISHDKAREKMLEMVPMQHFVSPENIAEGVLFLVSDRSAGITGEDLNISGGLVMY
jgi:meso-butanediol dehydrogenase/(S,S)-butanediol dehydrogenase/diacetyl reductase